MLKGGNTSIDAVLFTGKEHEALTKARRLSRSLASHIDMWAENTEFEPNKDDLKALAEVAWLVENHTRDLDERLSARYEKSGQMAA